MIGCVAFHDQIEIEIRNGAKDKTFTLGCGEWGLGGAGRGVERLPVLAVCPFARGGLFCGLEAAGFGNGGVELRHGFGRAAGIGVRGSRFSFELGLDFGESGIAADAERVYQPHSSIEKHSSRFVRRL